jgi:hypothetical protein
MQGSKMELKKPVAFIAYVQNCNNEPDSDILDKLRNLQAIATFPTRITRYKSHLLANDSPVREVWHYGIRFDASSVKDFYDKWKLLCENARTRCGCSLFYGDSGVPELAYVKENGSLDILDEDKVGEMF